MSTAQAIQNGIRKLPRGKPFTRARFLKYGSHGSVDRALSRLVGRGEILRVARGVFVRPKTSGSSRVLRIGNFSVRMVHTSSRRRLQFAGEAAGVALSALWYLGKDNVTPKAVGTIATALGSRAFEKLRSADMPAWMSKAIAEAALPVANG